MKTMRRRKDLKDERKVTQSDFDYALEKIKPAFGLVEEELTNKFSKNGIIVYDQHFQV